MNFNIVLEYLSNYKLYKTVLDVQYFVLSRIKKYCKRTNAAVLFIKPSLEKPPEDKLLYG